MNSMSNFLWKLYNKINYKSITYFYFTHYKEQNVHLREQLTLFGFRFEGLKSFFWVQVGYFDF